MNDTCFNAKPSQSTDFLFRKCHITDPIIVVDYNLEKKHKASRPAAYYKKDFIYT